MSYAPQITALRTKVQTMTNDAKALYATMEAQGDKASADDRAKLENMIDAGTAERKALEKLIELDTSDAMVNQPAGEKAIVQHSAGAMPRKSWGATVIESKEFKENNGREMKAVTVLNESSAVTGGALFRSERLTEVIDIARQQAPSILNLIGVSQTTTNAVEWVRMTARQNLAAVAPESTANPGTNKPQGDLSFDVMTTPIKTVAEWIVATRQLLQDAPRLMDTIDNELRYQIRYALEAQIVAGDGTGNNFTGILSAAGTQIRTMHATTPVGRGQVVGDTKATTLRKAITDIRLAFYEATAIAMNPVDSEGMELTEYTANRFLTSFDPVTMRVWRVPVVEAIAMPAGKCVVANWKMAFMLWDRMQAEVLISENVASQFIQNLITILVELRAGFATIRPQAAEICTLI